MNWKKDLNWNEAIRIGIGVILLFMFTSIASAETVYAGECLKVDLSNMTSLDNIVYDVVGNSSNLEGLTIDLDGVIASICTVPNYKPDNFTIIFIDNSTKEIIKEVPSGGGGSRTKKVYVENKTIVEVDKYIDRIIYNETEIIDLNDRIRKLEDDLDKRKKEIMTLIGFLIIWILLLVFLVNYVLKIKKGKK